MNNPAPSKYEDWLALSETERQAVHQGWNVYDREGYGFAVCAAGRLVIQSPTKIYHVEVGTYHGGEYVLHACVADEDFPKLPRQFEQTFEGFKVFWMPVSIGMKRDIEEMDTR
jgi:hypothetical protein